MISGCLSSFSRQKIILLEKVSSAPDRIRRNYTSHGYPTIGPNSSIIIHWLDSNVDHVLCNSVQFKCWPKILESCGKKKKHVYIYNYRNSPVRNAPMYFLLRDHSASPQKKRPTSKILSMSFATDMSFSTGRGPKRTSQVAGGVIFQMPSKKAMVKTPTARQNMKPTLTRSHTFHHLFAQSIISKRVWSPSKTTKTYGSFVSLPSVYLSPSPAPSEGPEILEMMA